MSKDLVGKRLLVLGGTRISCEIIRKAKQMGLTVAVADYFPVEKSPGKQIADEHYEVSTLDVDAVVDLIKNNNIDGVLTGFSDMLLPYYAEICKKAGLPAYGTKEQFETFIDKAKYKALCRQFNVPTVEEYKVDLESVDESIKYPVLVKPSDSSGSRGITICNGPDDLKEAVKKALEYSKENSVLVERYMLGREATVFWLFIDGEYYLTAIGNRHVKTNQGDDIIPLPVGYTYPAFITPKYRAEIEENAKKMFKYAGIENGMMFMQCKVEDDVCVVYDIGYRLTGSLEYINLESACGYNPLEMLIRFAVTGEMTNDDDISSKICPETMKPSFNVSCLSIPGTIKKIEGLDTVKAFPEVSDVVVAHYPGETITEQMRGLLAQITIRILGTVDRKEQLYDAMKEIEENIHIISSEGNEMRLMGIEPKDIEKVVL